jgi:outer membrane beta-barrel protein
MKHLNLFTMFFILNLFSDLSYSQEAQQASPSEQQNSQTAPAKKQSDKLDLKKLEDKYWSAKDSDFSVVQNRTYTKEDRVFVSLSYGALLNDPYSIGRITGLSLGYYPSERFGLEYSQESFSMKDNTAVEFYFNQNGVIPDHNKIRSYRSLNFLFVPLYSKTSFMNRKILYFDMQFGFGLGQMIYSQQVRESAGGNQSKSGMGYNFDFTQNLFISKYLSFRLDLKNKWTPQEKLNYNSGASLGTSTTQDTSMLLGLNIFF